MKQIVLLVLPILGSVGVSLIVGLFLGLLVFICWPVVIPAIFPGLVEKGIIAGNISFLASTLLCILSTILIKSTNKN